jgi:site-specific recombinase XerD
MYEYLKEEGFVSTNPAIARKVPPPEPSEVMRGQCLPAEKVQRLLAGPDRSRPEGARDYTLMLLMLQTSLRVSEACNLRLSAISRSHGRWLLKFKVKGGRERKMPLAKEVKEAIDHYLKLDRDRRRNLHSDGPNAFISNRWSIIVHWSLINRSLQLRPGRSSGGGPTIQASARSRRMI